MPTNEFNMDSIQDYNMPTKSKYDINLAWKKKNELKEYQHSLKKIEDFPRVYKMPLAETLNSRDIIRQQLEEWDYTTDYEGPYWPYRYAV